MTIELFRNDSYLKSCNSKIIKIDDNGIKLDQTIFYPEAGGQPGDKGKITIGNEEIEVIDTRYVNNEIIHVVENISNLNLKEEILERLNNLIKQNHEVSISSISETELDEKPDLVRTMAVKPPRGKGEIRMINIGKGIDYQPCGGTHVNNTSEIKEVKRIKVENKGRMNKRVIVDFLN